MPLFTRTNSIAERHVELFLEHMRKTDPMSARALSDSIGALLEEAAMIAVRRHGQQVHSMIDGTLYADRGDANTAPEDDTFEERTLSEVRTLSDRFTTSTFLD